MTPRKPSPSILTPGAVAERVGRSVPMIRRLLRRGSIPGAVQLGREWAIPDTPEALAACRAGQGQRGKRGPDKQPRKTWNAE